MNLPSTIVKKESPKYFWKTYPYKTILSIPWVLPEIPVSFGSPWTSENRELDWMFTRSSKNLLAERKLFVKEQIDVHCPKQNWFSRAIGIFGSGQNTVKRISYFFIHERPFKYFLDKNQTFVTEYFVPSKTLLSKGVQADTIEYRKSLYNNEYQWRVEIKKTKNSREHFVDIKNIDGLLFKENKNTYTIFTNEESNIVYLKLGTESENITKITKAELI